MIRKSLIPRGKTQKAFQLMGVRPLLANPCSPAALHQKNTTGSGGLPLSLLGEWRGLNCINLIYKRVGCFQGNGFIGLDGVKMVSL